MTGPRVHLFIDYQNVHLSAHERFAPLGTPFQQTQIHPALFADVVAARRTLAGLSGEPAEIHVFRGLPSPRKQPRIAAVAQAQAVEWSQDERVRMNLRALRYPRDWPRTPAQEKGVDVWLVCEFFEHAVEQRADVLILASCDSDLLPVLEKVRTRGKVRIEVVTWDKCSRLRFTDGASLWCTYLDAADFARSIDPRQY
ncbi:MAG: NYN domain-containing protein [Mycobacteriales bacterium]